jgi:hypothetical protein
MKARKWDEDTLELSKRAYTVANVNSISLAEQQRLIALDCYLKEPLLPEEWVIVRT